MSQKKIVLRNLRYSYSGPFNVNEFFNEMRSFLRKKGYGQEPKKHAQKNTPAGKRIEWMVEFHKDLTRYFVGTLRIRALLKDVKQRTITKKKRKVTVMVGDVVVYIDGMIISHISESYFTQKPIYIFIVEVIDRFLKNIFEWKHEGVVGGDGFALHKHIKTFFSLQRYKFQDTVAKP